MCLHPPFPFFAQAFVHVQRAVSPLLLLAIKRVVGRTKRDAFKDEATRRELIRVLRPLQELLAVMGRLRAGAQAWAWALVGSPAGDGDLAVLAPVTAALQRLLQRKEKEGLERG